MCVCMGGCGGGGGGAWVCFNELISKKLVDEPLTIHCIIVLT